MYVGGSGYFYLALSYSQDIGALEQNPDQLSPVGKLEPSLLELLIRRMQDRAMSRRANPPCRYLCYSTYQHRQVGKADIT